MSAGATRAGADAPTARNPAAYGEDWTASLSADGSAVAFETSFFNLVPGDTDGSSQIFVHELATGGTTLASASSAGAQANAPSSRQSISGDGRYVVFQSAATNLVPTSTAA